MCAGLTRVGSVTGLKTFNVPLPHSSKCEQTKCFDAKYKRLTSAECLGLGQKGVISANSNKYYRGRQKQMQLSQAWEFVTASFPPTR